MKQDRTILLIFGIFFLIGCFGTAQALANPSSESPTAALDYPGVISVDTSYSPMVPAEEKWPNCNWNCNAYDVQFGEAWLGTDNGTPLSTCNPGDNVTAYLWIEIYNNANQERCAIWVVYDFYRNGTEVAPDQQFCIADNISGKITATYKLGNALTWTCGDEIELRNLVVSCETCSGNPRPTCSNTAQCGGERMTKCHGPLTVSVAAPLVANAGPDKAICPGGSTTIGGSPTATGGKPPYTYSWSPTTGLDNPYVANPTASPSSTTTYTVTVTDNNSSTASDSMTLTIITCSDDNPCTTDNCVDGNCVYTPMDIGAAASSNSPVCIGSTIQLTGSPNGMASYSWSGPNGFSSNLQSPSISSATTAMSGTYTLTVADANGCSGEATVTVNVVPCGGGGGGGGGVSTWGSISAETVRCPLSVTVNMLGEMTTARMTSSGVLCEDCLAFDPQRQHSWEAKGGTQLLCANNTPPQMIELTLASSPPSPPSNTAIVGPVYDFTAYTSRYNPSPLTISPAATLALAYDPGKQPENTTALTIAYYDESASQWVPMETAGYVAGGVEIRNTLAARLTHLTYFAVLATVKQPAPAKFEVSNLTVTPTQAQLNQEINITVNVTNSGGKAGDYSLKLVLDGITKETKQVTLAPKTSQTVKFTLAGDSVGRHQVEISGLAGEFEVMGTTQPSKTNWWLIGGIAAGMVLLVFVTWTIMRTRQYRGY